MSNGESRERTVRSRKAGTERSFPISEEISSYRDLVVWQKACDLAQAVYRATRTFPKEKLFGLTSQIRRAAVSVPANIAEGAGRFGITEFRHFISVARGSLAELRTLLELAYRFSTWDSPRQRNYMRILTLLTPCCVDSTRNSTGRRAELASVRLPVPGFRLSTFDFRLATLWPVS